MDLINILWALVSLCIVVGVIYLILWVFGSLGLVIPANIVKVIWVILVLLALIFIIQHFFYGTSVVGNGHHRLP
jgi:hypothetical protein